MLSYNLYFIPFGHAIHTVSKVLATFVQNVLSTNSFLIIVASILKLEDNLLWNSQSFLASSSRSCFNHPSFHNFGHPDNGFGRL
jgi:hypothetical protein